MTVVTLLTLLNTTEVFGPTNDRSGEMLPAAAQFGD